MAEGWGASVPELLYSLLLVLHATELPSVLPYSQSQYFLVKLAQILTPGSKLHRVYANSSERICSHWPVHTFLFKAGSETIARPLFFTNQKALAHSGPKSVPAKASSG